MPVNFSCFRLGSRRLVPELLVRRLASSASERCCSTDAQRNSRTPATCHMNCEKVRTVAPERKRIRKNFISTSTYFKVVPVSMIFTKSAPVTVRPSHLTDFHNVFLKKKKSVRVSTSFTSAAVLIRSIRYRLSSALIHYIGIQWVRSLHTETQMISQA